MSGASSASRKILLTTTAYPLRLGDLSDREFFALSTVFLKIPPLTSSGET